MTTLNSVTLNKHHIVDIDLQDETLTLEHNNLTFYYSIIGLEDVKFFNDSYGVEGSAFINDNIDEVVSYELIEVLDEDEHVVDIDTVSLDESSINEVLSEKLCELHLKQSHYLDWLFTIKLRRIAMTVIEFIKKYGWEHSKDVSNGWITNYENIVLNELKSYIEAYELVQAYGGTDKSKTFLKSEYRKISTPYDI